MSGSNLKRKKMANLNTIDNSFISFFQHRVATWGDKSGRFLAYTQSKNARHVAA